MKKNKFTKAKTTSSHSDDIQAACDNIINLTYDIDETVKQFEYYIKKTQQLINPECVDELYYHEEKLVQYLHICAREFIMLATKTDRARLAAAKFSKTDDFDLSEYENNPIFIELTENSLIFEEAKMERIAAIGQICNDKINSIIDILDTSMRFDSWYEDDSEHAKNTLLSYVYQEYEFRKLFPHPYFSEVHHKMINDIFDERVEKLSPFYLIERQNTEEPKI